MPLPLGDFGAAVADFVPVGDWLFEIVPLAASNRPWPGRAEGPPLVSPPHIVARSCLRLSFSCYGTRKIRHPPPSFVRPWPGHPIPLYISLSLNCLGGKKVLVFKRWGDGVAAGIRSHPWLCTKNPQTLGYFCMFRP
jgi:hypothetical protein